MRVFWFRGEILVGHSHSFSPVFRFFFLSLVQLHKPIRFSTGPFTEYTHWKQTVFYLRQPLTICEGERIKGKITVKPNEKVSAAAVPPPPNGAELTSATALNCADGSAWHNWKFVL